jgi:hypothetical protein
MPRRLRPPTITAAWVVILAPSFSLAGVLPSLQPNLIDHYTFDSPLGGDPLSSVEQDLGLDATNITLVNGAPRVADGAWRDSQYALQTAQRNTGPNDDWKAGVMFATSAASTLTGTKQVTGVTVMGGLKPLGAVAENPSLNTNTPATDDYYNAFGLFGFLRGDVAGATDGHAARALLEVITGKVTGLGRRIDMQSGSGSRASADDWYVVLPPNHWTHLAATFDFDHGSIELYKNGLPLAASAASVANWQLTADVDRTSNTAAGGIKIGGSYPDDSQEFNPFNGRSDELMAFNKTLTAQEVLDQFRLISAPKWDGDFDRDSFVDGADFVLWQRTLGSTLDLSADVSHDNVVNDADLPIWSAAFGTALPDQLAMSVVPEPTALALAVVGVAAVGRLRRFLQVS